MTEPSASVRGTGIAGAAFILVLSFVGSRLTGLLRDMAIGYQFGTGRELDAYLAAIRIPDLVFQIAAGGAVAAAFIPVYTAYLVAGDRQGASRLLSAVFNLAFAALVPILIVIWIIAPYLIALLAPGFEPAVSQLSSQLARILIVSPLFFTIGCFATSALNSHRRFAAAALSPTAYNLGLIFGALVLARWFDIYGLAWGAVLGSFLFLVVQIPGLSSLGAKVDMTAGLRHPGVVRMLRLLGPRAVGLSITQLNFVVILVLASPLPGAVSALNYAWLLTMMPLGIFAMAVSTAAFPMLADVAASGDNATLDRTAGDVLGFILYMMIPSAFGMIVVAEPLITLLFQRGAFDIASTVATSLALRVYAVGLLGMGATEILARLFYARQDTARPLRAAFVALLVNAGLALALVSSLGLAGLAGATSVAALVEAALLLAMAQGQAESADLAWDKLFKRTALVFLCSFAMAALTWGTLAVTQPLATEGVLGQLLRLAVTLAVGGGSFYGLTSLAGLEEARRLRVLVASRLGLSR